MERGWYSVFWSRQLNLKIARETSELWIHYLAGSLPQVGLYVVNNTCAVVKTPTPKKVSQVPSFNGEPVEPGKFYPFPFNIPTLLDVETEWKLEICTDYIKSINWLGIPSPENILFDLPALPGQSYTLVSRSRVELEGDENPENDHTDWSPQLIITVMEE